MISSQKSSIKIEFIFRLFLLFVTVILEDAIRASIHDFFAKNLRLFLLFLKILCTTNCAKIFYQNYLEIIFIIRDNIIYR